MQGDVLENQSLLLGSQSESRWIHIDQLSLNDRKKAKLTPREDWASRPIPVLNILKKHALQPKQLLEENACI